jgi:hypothetical protein
MDQLYCTDCQSFYDRCECGEEGCAKSFHRNTCESEAGLKYRKKRDFYKALQLPRTRENFKMIRETYPDELRDWFKRAHDRSLGR